MLAGAQDLLHDPRRRHCHDSSQPPLVGGQEQAGNGALKPAGEVDRAYRLNGADEGAALGYDAGGCVGIRRAAQTSLSAATPAAGGGTVIAGDPQRRDVVSRLVAVWRSYTRRRGRYCDRG